MKRTALTLAALLAPLPAHAHVGHLAERGGHDHMLALFAMIAAVVVAFLIPAKRTDREEDR